MRILSLKVTNNAILGDFEIDFRDEKGQPVDTIILAGENGSGKSTLLDILFSCTKMQNEGQVSTEINEYSILFTDREFEVMEQSTGFISINFKDECPSRILNFKRDFSITDGRQLQVRYTSMIELEQEIPLYAFNNVRGVFKGIFSDVAINFIANEISNVTSSNIDAKVVNTKSSQTLATEVTQLLIDISSLDSDELQTWVLGNHGVVPPNEVILPRIKRFTNAFEYMFPSKKYHGISTVDGKKKVLFADANKFIPLDKFSSGEKQIVFRGGFLLKDKGESEGAVVLIDEPELSLHPRWQMKILNYYKKLFTNEHGDQTNQLFIATHSPFIIHNADRYNDAVFVLEKGSNGDIVATNTNAKFFDWSHETVIEEAFKIKEITTKTVFVEGELDERYFAETVKLYAKKLSFEIRWIGRTTGQGKNEMSGQSGLDKMKAVCLAQPQMLMSKVILFYDNDSNKPPENYNHLLVRSAPNNYQNKAFNKGIESLILLPNDFSVEKFRSEKIKDDGKGGEIIKKDFQKTSFCDYILGHNEVKKSLSFLNHLLDELEQELQ